MTIARVEIRQRPGSAQRQHARGAKAGGAYGLPEVEENPFKSRVSKPALVL